MKKKLTLLLFSLLCTLGSWATVTMPTLTTDPSNPVLYCIQSYRAFSFVQYAGDETTMTPTFEYTNASARFYFVAVNGTDYSEGVKIVSNVNGKKLNGMSGFDDTGSTWYFSESTYATGCFNIGTSSSFANCWDCNSSGVMTTDYWIPNTEGSTWQILSIDCLPQYQVSTIGSPKWYYLKSGRGNYVYANGSSAGMTATNPKSDAYKFAFISAGNHGVNIVSKSGLDAGVNQYLTTSSPYLSDNASAWYYVNGVRSAGYFVLSDANDNVGYPHLLNDNGNGGLAKWYVDGNPGSYFEVEEVLPVCDVTYTYTYGGNNYTETETQNIGAPVSLPASIKFPYTNYSFDEDVVPDAGTATINVTVTGFDLPFTVSADYENATWYYLQGHSTFSNYYISTNENASKWETGKARTDAYRWAFIGNPIDGIKLINKASGDGKYLTDTNDATSMTTTATEWVLKRKTDSQFGLWSTLQNNYANCHGGGVKYWSSFDQGSTFWVEDASTSDNSLFTAALALEDYPYGLGFNQYSLEIESTDRTSDAATIISGIKSEGMTDANLVIAQQLLDGTSFNLPAAGTLLRVETSSTHISTPTYLTSDNINVGGYNNCAFTQDNSKITGEKTILYYDGTSLLGYSTGLWLKNYQGYAEWYTEPVATGTSVAFMQAYNGAIGKYNIKFNNARYLYTTSDANGIYSNAGYTAESEGYNFTLEEVTSLPITMHEVDGAYYATINLPVAVTIPSGLSAYSATAAGDVLTLTKVVEDGVLAANQPVILYSEDNVTSLNIASTAGTAAASNELEGTTAAISVTADQNYVLGTGSAGVGFYKYSGTTMPGFKAYLPSSATSNVKAFTFSFEDAEDAIRAIESENSGLEIYDISGRRVQKAQKGLYIVNGKKVMYK